MTKAKDLSHLTQLLDEARRVYSAAEGAGVDVQVGHYRRLTEGAACLSRLQASLAVKAEPVGPELWGRQPGTGFWVQIDDGGHTDEQVASFEIDYAEAGWTDLRRANPFAHSGEGNTAALREQVMKAYELLNSGVPYSGRECKVSYALHQALYPAAIASK